MSQARSAQNVRANAHQLIADAGPRGLTSRQLRDGGVLQSDWAISELLRLGMIVRLMNVLGLDCVDGRYATVRNAR